MMLDYTYQQDSIKEVIPLNKLNQLPETGVLRVNRSEAVFIEPIPRREAEAVKAISTTPGSAIRKNWWQREQNLLVGNSRFIEPRNELNLVAAVTVNEGLHLPERPVNHVNYDWMTLLLLIAVGLFASVRTTWGKYMTSLVQSTVNYPTALRMYQEKNSSLMQGAFLLDVLFYLIFSVFLFQVFHFFRIDTPYQHFYLYLFCLILVVAYFLLKKSIYRFMGTLLKKKGETGEYLFNADNFKRVTGLVLIPMVAVIAFYPFSNENIPVLTGVSLILIIYSLLILRGFAILIKKQFSIFYLFLYFCTLEFLPLVLLYKILVV